jgi:hypothetical protein
MQRLASSGTGLSLRAAGKLAGPEQERGSLWGDQPAPRGCDGGTTVELMRGHWGIENRVHWVRDVTFDEDRCQVLSGSPLQVLATLRNLVISLIRKAGHTNVAAALRRHAVHPSEALALLCIPFAS